MPPDNISAQQSAGSGGNSIEETMSKVYDDISEKSAPEEKIVVAKSVPDNSSVADKTEPSDSKIESKVAVDTPEAVVLDEVSQLKGFVKEIDDVFAGWGDTYIQQAGVSRKEYMKNVLDIDRDLNKDPYRGIAKLAEMYGVDLRRFSPQQQAQATPQKPNDDNYIDPSVNAALKPVMDEVGAVKKQFAEMQKQAYRAKIDADIADFASKNIHYKKVEKSMENEVWALKNLYPHMPNKEILQRAYDNNLWNNPEVREILLNEAKAKQIEQSNAKVSAAKKAGASVTGSPSGKVQSQAFAGLSVEETMSKIWDQQSTGRIQ